MELIQANTPGEIEIARKLLTEYAAWIEINLCFQNFAAELAGLPGDYSPPAGRLLLATAADPDSGMRADQLGDSQIAGCVALRKIGPGTAEMKRLFLRPAFRGLGLGKALAAGIIAEAREIGYERLRLDTLPGRMDQAIGIYRSLGFREIPPYYENPFSDVIYMELELTSSPVIYE